MYMCRAGTVGVLGEHKARRLTMAGEWSEVSTGLTWVGQSCQG